MLTFIRYIEEYFTFALVDFVKSRFCSIHFTIILAGLKKIVRYTVDFVPLHCQLIHQKRKQRKKKCGVPQSKKHVRTTSKQTHAKQSMCALLQPRQKHKHNPVSAASIKAHVTQKQVSTTTHQTHTEQKHVQVNIANLNSDKSSKHV